MGERYKRILGALTEEELCRPALLQSRAKLRVAQETGEVRADMCVDVTSGLDGRQ